MRVTTETLPRNGEFFVTVSVSRIDLVRCRDMRAVNAFGRPAHLSVTRLLLALGRVWRDGRKRVKGAAP